MNLDLKDKVAVLAASSKGLGKATALELAREGARLVLSARSSALETTAAQIREQTGGEVLTVRADLTVPEDINRLIKKAINQFGRIDILIINVGGPPTGNFLDLQPSDWEAAVQLTLMSAVRLCYATVPHMLENGSGSIVAIESISVKEPIDNLILSNSIRMAVIGMLKSMANELGPNNIRINSINPTFTWTERVEQMLAERANKNQTDIQEEAAKIAEAIPLRRMGKVEEFGRAVAWLASPAASYIHGHALMFDGGAVKSSL